MTQISQLIGVHLVTADNNGLTVTTANGATLVAGGKAFALTASPSAVDLNEEASSLSSLQRSYQAASKVFSILDSIMSSALNLGTQTTVS